MKSRKSLVERLHPATHDGTVDGQTVFLSPAENDKKLRDQGMAYYSQMLLNPAAGENRIFLPQWFKSYEIRPEKVHIYILGDPSMGRTERSDNTAFAVWAVDSRDNRFLVDGARHKMDLSQRWETLRNLYKKWSVALGVEVIRVGYERYGLQSDLEHFEMMQRLENVPFPIEEVRECPTGRFPDTKFNTSNREHIDLAC
jgi:hypothetical protein